MRVLVGALVVVAVAVAGCSSSAEEPTSPCATGYLGDPAAAPELELRALKADGTDVPLADGDDLAILFPPQGGRVAFVGIRVRNVDGCAMQITGALRDPVSKQLRLDGRTTNLRRDTDGWGVSGRGVTTNIVDSAEIGDYANVPICPNQWASQDIYDQRFTLDVQIVDRAGKRADRTLTVVPRCADPGERATSCRCLCKEGYVLGETCTP